MGIILTSTGLPFLTSTMLTASRAAPAGGGGTAPLPVPKPGEITLQGPARSISYRGVTFTFSNPVYWYESAVGDPVVIADAEHLPSGTTITSINPASAVVDGYWAHGAEINRIHRSGTVNGEAKVLQGLDGLMAVGGKWSGHNTHYDRTLNIDPAVAGPITINPGDAFTVLKSVRKTGAAVGDVKVVEKYVPLTIMNHLPPRAGTWHRPAVSTTTKAWPNRPVEEMNLTGSGTKPIFRDLPKVMGWGNLSWLLGHNADTSDFLNDVVAGGVLTNPSMWETTWDPGQRFVVAGEKGGEYAAHLGARRSMTIASLFFDPKANAVEEQARQDLAKIVIQWGIDCDGGHQRGNIHATGAGQWFGYAPAYALAAFALGDAAMISRFREHASNTQQQCFWVTDDHVGYPAKWEIGTAGSNTKVICETYQAEHLGKPEWTIQGWGQYGIAYPESLNDPELTAVLAAKEGSASYLMDEINSNIYAAYRSTAWNAHVAEAMVIGVLRNGPDGETGDRILRRNAVFDPKDYTDLAAASLAYVDRVVTFRPYNGSGVGPVVGYIKQIYDDWRGLIPQAPWTGAPDITASHDRPNFATGGNSGEIAWRLADFNKGETYRYTTEAIDDGEISHSQDGVQFISEGSIGTAATHTIDGLRPGTTHWCRWRQHSASGWSPWSPTWVQNHPNGAASTLFKTDRGKVVSSGTAPGGSTAARNVVAPAICYKPYPLHEMPFYERAPADLSQADLHGPGVTGVDRLYAGIGYWMDGSGSDLSTAATYQWQRNGVSISGETGKSYALRAGDRGASIRCVVTVGGVSATSNAVSIP